MSPDMQGRVRQAGVAATEGGCVVNAPDEIIFNDRRVISHMTAREKEIYRYGYMAAQVKIADDIEAHYTPLNGDVGPSDYDEGLHTAALLARGQCGYVDCIACARIARGDS